METFDVTIVGAGIAGSVLGLKLAQAGLSVLLLEKDAFPGKTNACGGLFDKPYFERYVADENIAERHIRQNVFIMPWGEVTFACDQVTVKRRVFDRYLAEQAQKNGAQLRTSSRALDYSVTAAGRVEITVKDILQNTEYTVQSKIIVFADGPQSLAQKNPLFNAQKNRSYWSYAYAYEVEGIPFDAQQIRIYLDPKLFPWGYGWIFPDREVSNVGVGTLLRNINGAGYLKERLSYFFKDYAPTAKLVGERPVTDKKGGYIPMWLLQRFSDDSQLVVGDAAGMVSPLFGAGIDYAIESAEMAAKAIEDAFGRGRFDAEILRTYDQALNTGFLVDLKKQMLVAKIIMFGQKFGRQWPVKLLAVIAFGAKYTRWDKIKIMLYPFLGRPAVKDEKTSIDHK